MRRSWSALGLAALLAGSGCAERHLVLVHGDTSTDPTWRTGPRNVRRVEFTPPRPHPSGEIVQFATPIPTTFDGEAAVPADP